MNEQSQQALDQWAEEVATLEPEVAKSVQTYAERLAADGRLSKADRDFAQAQADAVRRATRRKKTRASKSRKS